MYATKMAAVDYNAAKKSPQGGVELKHTCQVRQSADAYKIKVHLECKSRSTA